MDRLQCLFLSPSEPAVNVAIDERSRSDEGQRVDEMPLDPRDDDRPWAATIVGIIGEIAHGTPKAVRLEVSDSLSQRQVDFG